MHVLLTRPLEDSMDLIKRFKDKDITRNEDNVKEYEEWIKILGII